MPYNILGNTTSESLLDLLDRKAKKKRITLTPAQRIHIWEDPRMYGRACSICHKKITRLSDLQLDHTKPYSKGGTKLNLAHSHCNRMKASGSLRKIQKVLGIKNKKQRNRKGKPRKEQEGLTKLMFLARE